MATIDSTVLPRIKSIEPESRVGKPDTEFNSESKHNSADIYNSYNVLPRKHKDKKLKNIGEEKFDQRREL